MTLLQSVEQVLEAVDDLRDLRNRLAALDEERLVLEERIKARLAEIRGAATETELPTEDEIASYVRDRVTIASKQAMAPTDLVLETVNAFGQREVGALDIAKQWEVDDVKTINSIRTALSRLVADKKITKVGYGRYRSLAGGASAA